MKLRRIKDRAVVAQAIYNRPDIRERAAELYEETLALSLDDLIDIACLRYRECGIWDSAHSLVILRRLKEDAPKGREVKA